MILRSLLSRHFSIDRNNSLYIALFVSLIVISWLLYPIMLSWMFPSIKYVFALLFVAFAFMAYKYTEPNKIDYERIDKIVFTALFLYIVLLLIATLNNPSLHSFYSLFSYTSKYFFFIFCLFFLNKKLIYKLFTYYAYLTVAITIYAIYIGLGDYFNWLTYNAYLTDFVSRSPKVYDGGIYYHLSPFYFLDSLVYRLQGYSHQAGTYALSIIPALLWFLLVNKKPVYFFILSIGVVWSLSLSPILMFAIFIYFLYKNNIDGNAIIQLALLMVVFFLFYYNQQIYFFILDLLGNESAGAIQKSQLSMDFSHSRFGTILDRQAALLSYIEYFENSSISAVFFGIGAGNSFSDLYVNRVNIGFLSRIIDSGVIGGLLNMTAYALIFLKAIIATNNYTKGDTLLLFVSLSSMSLIILSIFRQPVDASYWQMWIYASFFVIVNDYKTPTI